MHSASCLYQNLRKYIDQSKVFGFFNKEDFAKTKSLDQRLPPLRKKIWSYPQYYSTIDDEHKCVGYSSVLFDSSCVTYIETFISKKLVQIYDLTFVKLKLNKPWFRGSFFKKPKFCFSLWHAHRNSSCSNDGFSATFGCSYSNLTKGPPYLIWQYWLGVLGVYLSVTSQLTVESRFDRAENA